MDLKETGDLVPPASLPGTYQIGCQQCRPIPTKSVTGNLRCSQLKPKRWEVEGGPDILTYNDRTVTHLHVKWGVALGRTVIGAGTRHLPPSRIHAPVTNQR